MMPPRDLKAIPLAQKLKESQIVQLGQHQEMTMLKQNCMIYKKKICLKCIGTIKMIITIGIYGIRRLKIMEGITELMQDTTVVAIIKDPEVTVNSEEATVGIGIGRAAAEKAIEEVTVGTRPYEVRVMIDIKEI